MIIQYTQEDFDWHYGFVDWKDKIILDLGGDYGSTAVCFLALGATKVIVSDSNKEFHKILSQYINQNIIQDRVRCIASTDDFIDLFNEFKMDIIKMDIEGAEVHLLYVPDNILKSVKEYVIECHTEELTNKILQKFKDLKFNILTVKNLAVGCNVVHAHE